MQRTLHCPTLGFHKKLTHPNFNTYSTINLYIFYTTRCFRKNGPFSFFYQYLKNYRAQKKLYNNLVIVLPVLKCDSQNGKTIPKVLYSLFWALKFFLNGYKNEKGPFFLKHPVANILQTNTK